MHGYEAYKKTALSGWSRIEMLLAIYDGTIKALDQGIEALNRNDEPAFLNQQMRITRLILLLLDGLDTDNNELAARVRDLCIFCVEQITTHSAADWTSAREILATLREGFEGIREEAIRLESQGVIPRLDETRTVVTHA